MLSIWKAVSYLPLKAPGAMVDSWLSVKSKSLSEFAPVKLNAPDSIDVTELLQSSMLVSFIVAKDSLWFESGRKSVGCCKNRNTTRDWCRVL
jgi:hypothetical protein